MSDYLTRLRRKSRQNYICRQALPVIGTTGAIGYILYCLVTSKFDPIMEGVAVVAVLFGLVNIAKQLLPLIRDMLSDRAVRKEFRSAPTDKK